MRDLRRGFLFLRHGEADWNRQRRCVGQRDRPLTEEGRGQAAAARGLIATYDPTIIFHSPLSRAAETARIVSTGLGRPLVAVDALKEACLGEKEGAFEGEPGGNFVGGWLRGAEIPGAEPYLAFQSRVVGALREIAAHGSSLRPLLVSHWAVNHALSEALGLGPAHIPHCRPWYYQPGDQAWRVVELG